MTKNKILYIVAIVAAIIVAVLILNGGNRIEGVFSDNVNINWLHVIISLIIGVLIGIFFSKQTSK